MDTLRIDAEVIMKKKRALKNMDIEEVSFVETPANKRKFLLIKREDGEITELTIKTDGTGDGTELSVNGEPVDDLTGFWFAFWPADDFDAAMVAGSYTVAESDDAEFDRETTFHLKKGNTMKLSELLKEHEIDPANLSGDHKSLLKFIDMMPPAEAESALKVIKASLVKEEEAPTPEEEDEGTPEAEGMSPEKIAEILSAMAQLNVMLPEDQRVVIKSEEPDKLDLILAILAKASSEKPIPNDPADPPDSMKDIMARLIKVEETTGQPHDDDDEEGEESALEAYDKLTKDEKLKKYGTVYGRTQAGMGFDLKQFLEGN